MLDYFSEKDSIYQRIISGGNAFKKQNIAKTKFDTTYLKIVIIFSSLIFFTRNFFILFLRTSIDIDNSMKSDKEDNFDFSGYSTNIKTIVLYNPMNKLINNINNNRMLTPNGNTIKEIEDQINLVKNHGIYGFGFYYFWPSDETNFKEPLNIIIQNKNLEINFFLIMEKQNEETNHIKIDIIQFYDDIKKYVEDERYIKFEDKYIIGINNLDVNENDINILRQKFRESGLGEIFILSKSNEFKNNLSTKNIFDGLYYLPSYDSLEKVIFYFNNTNGYFYTHLLYNNIPGQINDENNIIFRTSIPLTKYPIYINETKTYLYGDYTPEKFYFWNKINIEWTLNNLSKDTQYIFIDGFDNLQPDPILGYSNINSFSKALYGLSYIFNDKTKNFNLKNLEKEVLVLVQAHIYYTDLLEEIINKVNNIPVPFDLYITTNTQEKKEFIENYLKLNNKANKYEILITPNKGRDVIPCLIQLKDIIMKYKYFCHIHTKKHGETDELGNHWKKYLYENLLGNKTIIQQILSDFENHENLGLMFPEHFYVQIKYAYGYNPSNWKFINYLFDILFPDLNVKSGDIRNFPVGNMFWARTKAVYQMFNETIINSAPEERGQIDGTILHAIERFWPFLAKLNGYDYKTILYFI